MRRGRTVVVIKELLVDNWPGKYLSYENRVVLILSFVGGVAALDLLAFNFLGPFIADELNLTSGQVAMIAGASMLAWSFGAVTCALTSDWAGRRRIFLVMGLIAFGIASMGTALAVSFGTLLGARLLVGFCEGPVVPMESAIMHAESSEHRRGLNLGIVQNLGSQLVGGIIGPLVLVAIAGQLGWRYAFVIAAVPALIMATVVHFAIREPAKPIKQEQDMPVWQTIRSVAKVRNIQLCFLIGTFSIAWLTTMSIFVPLWLIRQLHFSPFSMSIALACLGIGGAIGSIVVPGLSDRIGRRPALVAFALSGFLLPTGLLFGAPSVIAVCGIALVGRLFAGIFPLFIAIIPMESVGPRRGAIALSMLMGGAQICGGLIGPVFGGFLADRYSMMAPFWLTFVMAILTAFFGLFLRETAPARVKQAEMVG
jgi:MFS transporter, ACS family, hexuronate transporter